MTDTPRDAEAADHIREAITHLIAAVKLLDPIGGAS